MFRNWQWYRYFTQRFKKGSILELSDPTDGSPPALRPGSYRLPSDFGDRTLRDILHETKVASVIGGRYCGFATDTRMVDVYVKHDGKDKCGRAEYSDEDLLRKFKNILAFMKANPKVRAVVNASLGSLTGENYRSGECVSREEWIYPTSIEQEPEIDEVIKELYYIGVLVIASAGNECIPGHTAWPASNPYVLAVGSLDRLGKADETSNFGAAVPIWAPSEDVRVTGKPPSEYMLSSGTSFAAPFISAHAWTLLAAAADFESLRTPAVRAGALRSMLYSRFSIRQGTRCGVDHKAFREVGNEPDDGEDDADFGDDGDTKDNMALYTADESK